MDDIEQKVKKIIAEQLGIKEEDIKNESSFIEDLGADSLTTVEMSLALEDAFDIEIPDTEQENLRTVQHLKELGIDITYFETPGYHDWQVWRHSFRAFVTKLFRPFSSCNSFE